MYEMMASIFDRRIRISFTNFWVGFKPGDLGVFLKTIENNCSFSTSLCKESRKYRVVKYYSPHIHFLSTFGDVKKVKDSNARVKIFYSGENVDKTSFNSALTIYNGSCIDSVDLSLGFNYTEADNYIRFPLWFLYFFSRCSSKDEIKSIFDTAENAKRQYQKIKFCSLISRHDTSGLRTKIYNDVTQIANVDCPGIFLHNDDTLKSKYNDNKRMYLQQYKFNICPENSIGEGYCTEKIFDCLFSGCIPIYNGWSKNPEPDIVNPNIILWYDEFDLGNNKCTLNEIKKLHENDKLYRSFVEQPFFCDTAVDKIYDILATVNDKIREILVSKKII
jgi:hypothetical protein